MRILSLILLLLSFSGLAKAQIVSLSPATAGANDQVTITFDAAAGNAQLKGASKIYIHHGVVTDKTDGTDWKYVKGNWGKDDGVGEMTKVSGETDKWEISFMPSVREYFGVPSGTNIFRLSMVFRSTDGTVKATTTSGEYPWGTVTAGGDIFMNLNMGNFLAFSQPNSPFSYKNKNDKLTISASASANVSKMELFIDNGNGYESKASVAGGTTISYDYTVSQTEVLKLKLTGTINGENFETEYEHNVVVVETVKTAALPNGVLPGINYNKTDETKATLVLQAPNKGFAFVVGDFTNWQLLNNYQMHQTPDNEYFWLEINGLTPKKAYVFQYWVDMDVKIGDPYAEQTADPWNDQYIEEEVFANLPEYNKTDFQTATVLQTGLEPYEWASTENEWKRPDDEHLVIYELLVRDFLASHSFKDLVDTLTYLKRLGVDAIELMPLNEFEGNESWGYNATYYFALDKYYGNKNDLKKFIETAHAMGFAVILDMVLNHAYGQNPMVKLYFNNSTGKPAADNPWFNVDAVGPYSWGYDFNHESEYTKNFIDRVNKFWLEEYHIDGYRFDFTKGFTNNGPNIDNYDADRIAILKRMADKIWEFDEEAYVILEHWGPTNEEAELGEYGMKMWKNRSYDYVPAAIGDERGNFNGMDAQTHVSYFNSHDEQRIAQHMLTEGRSNGVYNIKNPLIMYERAKMTAAFMLLVPGPKMIWQFDELGYDIDIDFNGRVGNKPLPWGAGSLNYYSNENRQYIYDVYSGLMDIRHKVSPEKLATAKTNHALSGNVRILDYDTDDIDLIVIGNFGLDAETITLKPTATQIGTWYNYFSGEELEISANSFEITLAAGEWHVLTSTKLSNGIEDAVEIFENPVSIYPQIFTQFDQITITFDASKAWPNGTNGLVDAEKVYFHSGVVINQPNGTKLENVVGNFTDNGIGEMTKVGENLWEITLTPNDYYSLSGEEAFRIGMWFRDAANENVGYGFRNSTIFFEIDSDKPFITIEPAEFWVGDEITITFNARKGNKELVGATSVYMHSGAGTKESSTPWTSVWNNAVGNWGLDDGIGKMTKVAGQEDMWQIKLTPKNYYKLKTQDQIFWLGMVFRSADGNTKGTGTPGEIENGIIHTNQDFFIRNNWNVSVEQPAENSLSIYPNPSSNQVYISFNTNPTNASITLLNIQGQLLKTVDNVQENTILEISDLKPGMYFIQIFTGDKIITKELIKY